MVINHLLAGLILQVNLHLWVPAVRFRGCRCLIHKDSITRQGRFAFPQNQGLCLNSDKIGKVLKQRSSKNHVFVLHLVEFIATWPRSSKICFSPFSHCFSLAKPPNKINRLSAVSNPPMDLSKNIGVCNGQTKHHGIKKHISYPHGIMPRIQPHRGCPKFTWCFLTCFCCFPKSLRGISKKMGSMQPEKHVQRGHGFSSIGRIRVSNRVATNLKYGCVSNLGSFSDHLKPQIFTRPSHPTIQYCQTMMKRCPITGVPREGWSP